METGILSESLQAGYDQAQLSAGYGSSSGFRDAFAKTLGAAPAHRGKHRAILLSSWIDTPLGPMLAIASEEALVLLEFVDRRGLEREIEHLRKRLKSAIVPGDNAHLEQINGDLQAYFEGSLKSFKTPIALYGSAFQKQAWAALQRIPYGQTRSYREQAEYLNKPTAFRAVARANGANQLALIIPCHRVINSNGELGGYGAGLHRKQWLLEHEQRKA